MTVVSGTREERRAAARRRQAVIFVAGVAFLALVVATVAAIIADFNGDFSSYVEVRANLPVGQPVTVQSEVQYRQIAVGQVAGVSQTFHSGAIQVTLRIKPDKIGQIPADVTAQVAPSSIFGTEAVVLRAGAATSAHLRSGAVVPAAGESSSLQGALTDLDHLLTGLHPAEIDTTLGALSTAFQGQGPAVDDAIHIVNGYLDGLLPELPTLESDINLVTPVLDGLSASVPALLDIATNSGTVATTLTNDQALIASLLSKGSTLTATASGLLSGVQTTLHSFLVNLGPILLDINGRPGVLANSITALDTLSKTFLPAFTSSGSPSISVAVSQFTDNPELALLAGASLPFTRQQITQIAHAAFVNIMDPPTYSAADCPRYGAAAGPNCAPSGASAAATATVRQSADRAATPASARSAVPSGAPELTAAQQSVISSLMQSLSGHSPAQPSTADLILGALLQSLAR